jgi:AcrR family transcriptional regulator
MKQMTKQTRGKARSGTAIQTRGKARVADILASAKAVLVSDGLSALTTRRVAEDLGISIGNLAYYFPSKDALLQAIVAHVIEGYDKEFEQESKSFPNSPRERLQAFFRYLIEDSKRPEVQRFFYQFWGLATQNAEIAKARTAMYQHFAAQLLKMLIDIHPGKSASALEHTVFALLACIEGLHVVYGSGNIDTIHSAEFDDHMLRQLLNMADILDLPR